MIITLGFAPGIFWLWYLYQKDKWEPEPKTLVIKAFFLGILVVIPALILEAPFQMLNLSFLLIIIVAPVVEEILKFMAMKRFIYQNAEFDEPMDGIVYATAVALGFASVENLFYLISAQSKVMIVFAARAILSVPGHALFSSMWGYALGQAKFSDQKRATRLIWWGLLSSIGAHCLFNLFASITVLGGFGLLMVIGFLWWILLRRIARVEKASPFKEEKSLSRGL